MSSKPKAQPVSRFAIATLIATFLMLVALNGFVAYLCIYDLNPHISGWPILRMFFREFWLATAAIALVVCLPVSFLNYRYFALNNAHRKVTWYSKICLPLCILPGLIPIIAYQLLRLIGGV